MQWSPNPGKELTRQYNQQVWARYPVRTHVVQPGEDIAQVVQQYAAPHLQAGDVLVISEKVVAICQRRAFPVEEIHPRPLARWLSRFVTKTPHGIGIGSPVTMELALREAGVWRILLAAAVAAVTKPLGIRGMFYRVAGRSVAAIDGPTPYTLPPYNRYASLAPKEPNKVAQRLAEQLGVPVAIVDANDLGVEVLGASKGLNPLLVEELFRDNPLGQGSQQTPLCILRRVG
ncbi:MAG: coenzyme F420-0:L-glutamate ligase [Armatimonadota bacterium]|nr:coenzyme F420-0:L-glutamate ligase [Armatimonadota bacterium]MDW8290535.1 coenzyme F420-0:L-glutamate ligase [Armatimonadota bacterium]